MLGDRAGSLPGMLIDIVNPVEWMPKVRHLIEANWHETGLAFPFDPDLSVYAAGHAAGRLFAVRASFGGETVGYCTVAVVGHHHNPAVLFGANDGLYVSPTFRGGTAAGRLIVAAEKEAQARGARWFSWHCRTGTPLADVLISRGYTPTDTVVMKEF